MLLLSLSGRRFASVLFSLSSPCHHAHRGGEDRARTSQTHPGFATYETGYGIQGPNGKMDRVKPVVNYLTRESPFKNCEDVANVFIEHIGDVLLVICRLNVSAES